MRPADPRGRPDRLAKTPHPGVEPTFGSDVEAAGTERHVPTNGYAPHSMSPRPLGQNTQVADSVTGLQ